MVLPFELDLRISKKAIYRFLIYISPLNILLLLEKVKFFTLLSLTAFFWLDSARIEKYTVVVRFCGDNLRGDRNETPDDMPPVCVRNSGMQ